MVIARRAHAINTDKPWSPMDIEDLRVANTYGATIQETARFLYRTQREVFEKSRELGIRWTVKQRGRRSSG